MAAAEVNPDMTGFDMKVMRNPEKKKLCYINLHLDQLSHISKQAFHLR